MDYTDFSDIAPFNDEEAAAALARVSIHPNVPWIPGQTQHVPGRRSP